MGQLQPQVVVVGPEASLPLQKDWETQRCLARVEVMLGLAGLADESVRTADHARTCTYHLPRRLLGEQLGRARLDLDALGAVGVLCGCERDRVICLVFFKPDTSLTLALTLTQAVMLAVARSAIADLESVVGVFEDGVGGVDVGDHDELALALQGALQQMRQLRVAVLLPDRVANIGVKVTVRVRVTVTDRVRVRACGGLANRGSSQ